MCKRTSDKFHPVRAGRIQHVGKGCLTHARGKVVASVFHGKPMHHSFVQFGLTVTINYIQQNF